MIKTSQQANKASLITCVIARSNPRRLFEFYARDNAGNYQSTMTRVRDVMSAECVFS